MISIGIWRVQEQEAKRKKRIDNQASSFLTAPRERKGEKLPDGMERPP
jgi:hypothetical protein